MLQLNLEYKAVFCFLKLSKQHDLLIYDQNTEKLNQKRLCLILGLFRSDRQSESLLELCIHFPRYQIHNYLHHEEERVLFFSEYVLIGLTNKLNQVFRFLTFRIQLSILHNIFEYL